VIRLNYILIVSTYNSSVIDFFTRHEEFTDSLEKVSKRLIDRFIKDFISKIKQITKREDKDSKVSELTTRLTFFNIFSNFRKNLISLKSKIKEVYNETTEQYHILFPITISQICLNNNNKNLPYSLQS